MSWYRTGTVAVTNGSPTITGTGTAWADNIEQGWGFIAPDGKLYEVLTVNSATSITLATNYTGTTASGQAYAMFPTQGLVRALTAQVLALISSTNSMLTGAGAGKFADGSAAAPSISFAADVDSGFYRYGANSVGLATGGALRMLVDPSGRLGLGTASPQYTMHVAAANPTLLLQETDAATDEGRWRAYVNAGTFVIGATNDANDAATTAYFISRSGVTVTGHSFQASASTALHINAAGNVGIGTTSPAAALHVQKAGTDAKLRLQSTTTGASTFGQGALALNWVGAVANATNKYAPGIKWGSSDADFATTNPKYGAAITAEAVESFNSDTAGGMALAFWTAPTAADGNTAEGILVEHMRIDSRGNSISRVNTSAPGLTVNQMMVFSLTSNTNLRVSVRGTDGVTRVANLPWPETWPVDFQEKPDTVTRQPEHQP